MICSQGLFVSVAGINPRYKHVLCNCGNMDTTAQKCWGGSNSMFCSSAVWKEFLRRYFGDFSLPSLFYTTSFGNLLQQVTQFSETCFFSVDLHSASSFSRPGWEQAEAVQFILCAQLTLSSFLFPFLFKDFADCIPFSLFSHLQDTLESLPRQENCHVPLMIYIWSWSLFQYHWPTSLDRDLWPISFWGISGCFFFIAEWGVTKSSTHDFHEKFIH